MIGLMKTELVIATTNPGKFGQLKDALAELDLDLKSLADFPEARDREVVENGKDEEENARIKAQAFGEILQMPVLGMDNGLYIDGLRDELQPGREVRRFWGEGWERRPTDEELLAHFSGVIRGLGGRAEGYWKFAVCIRDANGKMYEAVLQEPRVFVWLPAKKMELGYPLESLQVDAKSGRSMSELSREEISDFWQQTVGKKLVTFVSESLSI